MPANILPSGIDDLFQLAERMHKGIAKYGPWFFQDPTCATDFAGFLKLAREAERTFQLARAEKATAGRTFAAADAALTTWLAKARLVVMLAYGSKWSETWIAAGFTHRGTNVPKRIRPRIELSRRLAAFFAAHGEYEVPFAAVTAAEARRLQKAIEAAEEAVRLTKEDAERKKRHRDAAEKKLRHEMHFTVVYVGCSISKSDPRWLAFGLNRPQSNAPAIEPRKWPPATAELLEIDFAGPGELAADDLRVA
jgi:hypothetical protein